MRAAVLLDGKVLRARRPLDHRVGPSGRRMSEIDIRWDAAAERFWVARVSANSWRWRRGPRGWRIVEHVNRNLDGTEEPRAMFRQSAPAGPT